MQDGLRELSASQRTAAQAAETGNVHLRTTGCSVGLAALGALCMAAQAFAQVQSVTLDQAIGMALRAQPAMVQARGQVTNAAATKRQAIGNWLPDLRAPIPQTASTRRPNAR